MDKNVTTFNVDSDKYCQSRPKYPKQLYEILIAQCKQTQEAWDCGCGNGQVAIDLVPYFDHIEASDININPIEHAHQNSKIHYSVQNSENTGFKDNQFDLICAAQCIHWFKLDLYFKEVKRLLKPGGVFACWGYSFFKINHTLDPVIQAHFDHLIDPYWSEKNRILHKQYKEIRFPFSNIQTPQIEMGINWTREELLDYLATLSATKRYNDTQNTSITDSLRDKIKSHWAETEKKAIQMDFFVYICTE